MNLFTSCLLLMMASVVLAGNIGELLADMEEEFKNKKMSSDEDVSDYGENSPPEVWGDLVNKGWGAQEDKGWGRHRSKGWGDDGKSRSENEVKDSVKDLMLDFRQYIQRKGLKDNGEKISQADIYQEIEKVELKKYLTEELTRLNEAYEAQRLRLCQGDSARNQDDSGPSCQLQQPTCGLCGRPINVTLEVKNVQQPPFFQFSVNVLNEPKRELLSFMEKAAENEARFKFTSTYFKGLGYFIDSINGLAGSASNKTYWNLSSNGTSAECGVSSYVLRHEESILFNFTTY